MLFLKDQHNFDHRYQLLKNYNLPLALACDDAKIWVWDIPQGGLTETLTEPRGTLRGHMEKIYFVIFHPLARDIIVTSAYDFTVRIWDLSEMKEVLQLFVHPDQVWAILLRFLILHY